MMNCSIVTLDVDQHDVLDVDQIFLFFAALKQYLDAKILSPEL